MESTQTQRGFSHYQFQDGNGANCSLQESSAARCEQEDGTVSDGFIWLGIDSDRDGFRPGRQVADHNGKMVSLGARMHLTQTQVREMLPLLTHFAEHGELPEAE
jgi:hypothetical protein